MTSNDEIKKLCQEYLQEEPDALLRFEIEQLEFNGKFEELRDRLNGHLKFGTAGLRARMQAGYNRLNLVSIYRFSHALAHVLLENNKKKPLVVIAVDARLNGPSFAREVISVLLKMGIEVHVFAKAIPTPLCAFATKFVKADMGIMITASHNPGYDNGVKLFDKDTAQLCGLVLKRIEEGMALAPSRTQFYQSFADSVDQSALLLGNEVEDAYFAALKKEALFAKDEMVLDIPIAYTALHGVGQHYFIRALTDEGFKKIHTVHAQSEPDGEFPTLVFPNPEEDHVLDRVYDLAIECDCHFVFANDPDADRVQLSCRDSDGRFYKLSGNEMGSLLGYFMITKALERGKKPLVASSIVSSRMLSAIASKMGVRYVDGLTGFGNIIYKAKTALEESDEHLVFAYEEAIGFLVGQNVLDKDGIGASVRFMEIIAWLKKRALSLSDFMDELSLRFGLFMNCQWSKRYEGIAALNLMNDAMARARKITAEELGALIKMDHCQKYDLSDEHNKGPYSGVRANIIIFEISDAFRFIVRPSGTEPKIKFYVELMSHVQDLADLRLKKDELSRILIKDGELLRKLFE